MKLGPLDLKSDSQLCFLMAVAADRHGARAAWIELDKTGRGIKRVNFLADQSNNKDEAIVSLDFERLKRNPRTVPLSKQLCPKTSSQTGVKSWAVRYRTGRSTRKLTLQGRYPVLSLAKARRPLDGP